MLLYPPNNLYSKQHLQLIRSSLGQDSFNADNASFVAADITASEAFGK